MGMCKTELASFGYIADIKRIVAEARNRAYNAINFAMVEAYWLTGKRIVEEEQHGEKRAEYGKEIIKNVSIELTKEFGKGFSERSIRQYRQFFQMFPELSFDKDLANGVRQIDVLLSWSHIQRIMRVGDPVARAWYLREAAEQMWSFKTLDRNIGTMYYQRLLSSQQKEPVVSEMHEKTSAFQNEKLEFIKNPAVLEFLGLPDNSGYTENELETAIIDHMQQFLLELGKGFAFISRQKLVRTETADFYIDLVFYNYILKCFVIIELKTRPITHEDIGQLDMYVRMYDDLHKQAGDNQTIGILLCTETDKTIARYSVLNENKQLFATKYMPYLPTEEELAAEIEKQKELLRIRDGDGNE
jgi:predicted nuclease of restriction endonuclease-like (RecB) superfamily